MRSIGKRVVRFASGVAIAAALAFAGGSAMAQEKKVRANMAGAFPSSMGILGPAQARTVDLIKKLSNGSVDIKFFEPGALVPGSQYFDAISNGSLDMAYTAAGYFTGKDIAFAMFTTVPFGPGAGEYMAWFEYGGGNQLMKEMHAKYNIVALNCGLQPPEGSGWFRKEIKSLEDLKARRAEKSSLALDIDEAELAESLELPGADLSAERLTVEVLPRQADEFTCSKCFLVHHRSQLDHESALGPVCNECA